jgi:WD40 repeat protein
MWIQKVGGGGVRHIAYAPDGRTLYTLDMSGSVFAWDTASHAKTRLFQLPRSTAERYNTGGLFLADSGRYLVLQALDRARVWDLTGGRELTTVTEGVARGLLKPARGATLLYLGSMDRSSVVSHDLVSGRPTPALRWEDILIDFDPSPDGRTLAVLARDQTVWLADLEAERRTQLSSPATATGVRFSPDGSAVVRVSYIEVAVWDLGASAPRFAPVSCALPGWLFALSPTGAHFAALNPQREFTIFSMTTGEPIRSLDFALGAYVQCACFAPDGLTCAVGGSNKQFAVFDVDV